MCVCVCVCVCMYVCMYMYVYIYEYILHTQAQEPGRSSLKGHAHCQSDDCLLLAD